MERPPPCMIDRLKISQDGKTSPMHGSTDLILWKQPLYKQSADPVYSPPKFCHSSSQKFNKILLYFIQKTQGTQRILSFDDEPPLSFWLIGSLPIFPSCSFSELQVPCWILLFKKLSSICLPFSWFLKLFHPGLELIFLHCSSAYGSLLCGHGPV